MVNIFKRGRKAAPEGEDLEAGPLPGPDAEPQADAEGSAPETQPVEAPRRKLFGRSAKKAEPVAGEAGAEVTDAVAPKSSGSKGFSLSFGKKGGSEEPSDFDPAAPITPAEDKPVEYDGEGAIKVGKTGYALNLEWRSIDTNMRRAEQAALVTESSRHDNVSLFVDLTRADVVGFGAKAAGHRAGMKVLLTALSKRHMGDNWIGAFRIGETGDTWWVGAMKDGAPYEDTVVASQEDARITVLNELSAGWSRIVAPEDWHLPSSIDVRLIDVLASGQVPQLRDVAPIKAAMPKIIGGLVLFAVLGGGYYWYSSAQEAERQRMAEQLRLERETVRLVPSEFPWHEAPPIMAFLETCREEIAKTITLVPGWEAEPLTCTIQQGKGSVATGWVRTEDGRFEWLRMAMPESTDGLAMGDGGRGASLTRFFEGPKDPLASQAQPWTGAEIERILRQRYMNLGLDITMNEIRNATTGRGKAQARAVSYGNHTIQLRTVEAIDEWAELLADVPALVPDVLVYNIESGEWNLVVKAYHPPVTGR